MKNMLDGQGVNDALPAVVAAVTSYVNDSTLSQCLEIGMVDVMGKPLEGKTLKTFIEKYYKA